MFKTLKLLHRNTLNKKYFNYYNKIMDNNINGQLYMNTNDILVISTEDLEVFNKTKKDNFDKKIVAVHSGAFHADDVLSCSMSKYITGFRNLWIVRSRNISILNEADMVCDVGGIFDPEKNRFDHHMKEFTHVFDEENKIKMSSAGLVYKYYGKHIIENLLKLWNLYDSSGQEIDKIYNKVYLKFIASVDAGDNGINQYSDDIKPKYIITTTYPHRISRLNPEWNEPNMDQSTQFKLAMLVGEEDFLSQVKYVAKSWIPAYAIVKKAVENRKSIHSSGSVILLETSCPWKEHIYEIEKEQGIQNQILFVIYKQGFETSYRIQTVSLSEGNYKFRRGLREEWRGVNREDLKKISGIEDITFVHSNGFIGGAGTLENTIKMAELSLS